MMSPSFNRLAALIARDLKLTPERLTPESRLVDLGVDSLALVELLWSIEDSFRIRMPAEPVPLETLGDVARHIDELIAAQDGVPAALRTP